MQIARQDNQQFSVAAPSRQQNRRHRAISIIRTGRGILIECNDPFYLPKSVKFSHTFNQRQHRDARFSVCPSSIPSRCLQKSGACSFPTVRGDIGFERRLIIRSIFHRHTNRFSRRDCCTNQIERCLGNLVGTVDFTHDDPANLRTGERYVCAGQRVAANKSEYRCQSRVKHLLRQIRTARTTPCRRQTP